VGQGHQRAYCRFIAKSGRLRPGNQVAGQAAPLLLVGGDQLAEQVAALALHPLQVSDIHGHANHAGDLAARSASER